MAGRLKGAAKKIGQRTGKKVKTAAKTARTAALAATGITGATAGFGTIGKGFTKGANFFGGKKDPNVTPTTPMAGESASDAVQEVLQKI